MLFARLSASLLILGCSSNTPRDHDGAGGGSSASGGAGASAGGNGGIASAGGSSATGGVGGASSGGAGAGSAGGSSSSAGGSGNGEAGSAGAGGSNASGGSPGELDCGFPHESGAVTKVACVGDSITAGHGASDLSKSYPSQLGGLLGAEFDVGNFGRDSTTLLKNGEFPYWNQSQFGDAKAFLPNVVVIGLGTNDTTTGNDAHRSEFPDDYASMIDVFRGLSSHPVVFLAIPIWIKDDTPSAGYTNARLAEIITMIEGVAAEKEACTIDLNTVFEGHGELYSDTLHPNDAGYAVLAETVCEALGGTCN